MLTLLVTILATAYFVVPELLSRFVLGYFLIRKAMTAPKSEELMRGAFWAIFPLVIAWYTRNLFICKLPSGAAQSVKIVFIDLYSDKLTAAQYSDFFDAIATFARANFCLLVRTYLIIIGASVFLGALARKFGWVRERVKRRPILSKLLHWAVL